MRRFSDLEQNSAGLQVSDLEANKVDVVDVVLGFTEVPCNVADKRSIILTRRLIKTQTVDWT